MFGRTAKPLRNNYALGIFESTGSRGLSKHLWLTVLFLRSPSANGWNDILEKIEIS